MKQLEILDGTTWREFLASPTAVLVLGKSTCAACARWSEELTAFLDADVQYADVRFGKLYLDQPGLIEFKRENPWLAEMTDLPVTLVYRAGERKKSFLGGGVSRLTNRLDTLLA